MNIKSYKEYTFTHGILISTDTRKEYKFSISDNDRFYHYMEKYIIKEKVEKLSYENIDNIFIEDSDKTFFNEKSFILNIGVVLTDLEDNLYLYTLTMKNIKLKENKFSTKYYRNDYWELGLYSLEMPYQTDIFIKEVQD